MFACGIILNIKDCNMERWKGNCSMSIITKKHCLEGIVKQLVWPVPNISTVHSDQSDDSMSDCV